MTESFYAGQRKRFLTIAGLTFIVAVLPMLGAAQVATTTVQGTVYRADGSAATGTVLVSWPTFSTAANQAVAAGSTTATIGQDGFLSVNLAPNQSAYPAGSYYTVVYHLSDGTVSKEYWVVPAATTAAISSVRAQLAPATVAVQPVSKSYVDSSIAAITGNYLPLTGGMMSGALVLEGDPTAANQAATKHYADVLASSELPLAGGTLSGTLNTPNGVNKLPRVDVRHPDFGAACPNAADPTGQQDSTCPIQAAIAWSQANPQGHTYPTVYLAAGTYAISAALYVPCQIHLIGDGPQATVLEQMNNTANGVTVYPLPVAVQPNLWSCNGSLENFSIHAPGGHLYTATLIELQNAVGYTLFRVRGSNGGGRGLVVIGSTERLKAVDTEWDSTRWPIVATGNELKFLDTQIAAPGVDGVGYCMAPNNCVNGVFPSYNWTGATQPVISASGNGSTATFVVSGSPTIPAGGYFTISGLSGITALNGTFHSANLQCGVASIEISQQGPVWVVNTPPGGGPVVRRLGTTAQGADCKIERTGKLRFYATSTPQAGELIAISYRTSHRAVARLANAQSIAQESANGQLPGTAAWIGTVTSPATRSSMDCENAASALLDLATSRAAAWKGKYTAWNMEEQGDVWPGDVLAVSSASAGLNANLVVRVVQIEMFCTSPGVAKYVLEFANDWADALAIKTSKTVPANVWLPQEPEAEPPLANLTAMSVTAVTGSAIQVSANATPPTNGGFEVRRRDWAFGPGTNSDLVLRSPVANFTIPREAVMEQYFVRLYDGSTPPNYSRFSSAVFVNVAL